MKLHYTTQLHFIFVNKIQHPHIMKNNTDQSRKGGGVPSLICLNTKSVSGQVLVHSVDKTHLLVVTEEFIWLLFLNILSFIFVQTPNKSFRFRQFRSYVNHSSVVLTTVKIALLFMFYVHCLKWAYSFFA